MPTSYILVKRGKGFSVTDSGYLALLRDYPESWGVATGLCLALLRSEWREERDKELLDVKVNVAELPPLPVWAVEGLVTMRTRKRGSSATFAVLVPGADGDSFSNVFTFLISKGKTKETANVKSFLSKFPHNGLAIINWMESEVTGGCRE